MTIRPDLPRRVAAASMLLALLAPMPAHAHAILKESEPGQHESVPSGMVGIHLRYNSRIDWARSRLLLLRPDHSQSVLRIMPGGPPDLLSASATLAPGAYTIRWHVLATDGHLTRGDLRFTVTEP